MRTAHDIVVGMLRREAKRLVADPTVKRSLRELAWRFLRQHSGRGGIVIVTQAERAKIHTAEDYGEDAEARARRNLLAVKCRNARAAGHHVVYEEDLRDGRV